MNNTQESISTLPPTASAQENQNPQAISGLALQPVPDVKDISQLSTTSQTLRVVGAPVEATSAPVSASHTALTFILVGVTLVLMAIGLRLLNMSKEQE